MDLVGKHKNKANTRRAASAAGRSSGFTLIELSIVLVIIGLITGGVLTGQNLIQAAAMRATMAQIEKYNVAVNTFLNKYNEMPGDMSASGASRFGLAATSGGGVGLGDGNGSIQDPAGTNTPVGEILLFWRHLSEASLVDGSFGSDITVSTAQAPASINPAKDFPAAKSGRGSYIIVGSDSGVNYFGILGLVNGATGGASGVANYYPIRNPSLTSIEAYNIDRKMDDGQPLTGSVQVRGYGSGDILAVVNLADNCPYWTITPSELACIIGGTWPLGPDYSPVKYNLVGGTGGDTPNCEMRFKFN